MQNTACLPVFLSAGDVAGRRAGVCRAARQAASSLAVIGDDTHAVGGALTRPCRRDEEVGKYGRGGREGMPMPDLVRAGSRTEEQLSIVVVNDWWLAISGW